MAKETELKKELEKMIKNHVVNVLFNVKGIEGVYLVKDTKSNTSKRIETLDIINSTKGIKIDWVSEKLIDITILVKVSPDISITITHNLLKNLISDQLNKLPKTKLNQLFLKIEDIKIR